MTMAFPGSPPTSGFGAVAYSLWLMFEEGTSADLRSDICALARELGGTAFPPHLTLIGDMGLGIEEAEEIADSFRGLVPEQLQSTGLRTSPSYFLAVHAVVRLSDHVERMREELIRNIHGTGVAVDGAHVSLAYGTYLPEQLQRASAMLGEKYASRLLPVGRLSIVRSAKSIPISDWKPVRYLDL